jgi:hypothetical protein
MTFNKGDRVKFLDDVGKGTIISLIDKDMVLVQTDDGFEYPVLKKELIITDQSPAPEINIQTEEKNNQGKKSDKLMPLPLNQKDSDEKEGPLVIYFGISPANTNIPDQGKHTLYLINDSCFQILFHAGKGSDNKVDTIKAGSLGPGMKIVIGDYSQSSLVENNTYLFFQLIAFRNTNYTSHEPISSKIRLYADDLKSAGSFKKNKFIVGNALIIPVEQSVSRKMKMSLEDFKSAMVSEKITDMEIKKTSISAKHEHKKPDIQDIDLHIEQITDKYISLSSGEIIGIQLARFRTSLAGAILSGEKRIIFIHGIGAGKLKSEIRKTIDKEYPTCQYQDASFKEYGYGATLIIIK